MKKIVTFIIMVLSGLLLLSGFVLAKDSLITGVDIQKMRKELLPDYEKMVVSWVAKVGVTYKLYKDKGDEKHFARLTIGVFKDEESAESIFEQRKWSVSVGPVVREGIGDQVACWKSWVLLRRRNVVLSFGCVREKKDLLKLARQIDEALKNGVSGVTYGERVEPIDIKLPKLPGNIEVRKRVSMPISIQGVSPADVIAGATALHGNALVPKDKLILKYYAPREPGKDEITVIVATSGNVIHTKTIPITISPKSKKPLKRILSPKERDEQERALAILRSEKVTPYQQNKAIISLMNVGDNRAVPILVKYLSSKYGDVSRQNAARALGKIKDKRAVPPLINLLKDDNEVIRRNAINALAEIGDKRATPSLIEALKDGEPAVRIFACRALGKMGDKRAIPALLAAYKNKKDPEPDVRYAASTALNALGEKVKIIDERGEKQLKERERRRAKERRTQRLKSLTLPIIGAVILLGIIIAALLVIIRRKKKKVI